MNAMQTEHPTNADELNAPDPTAPPTSNSRDAGNAWYCRMMAEAQTASRDAARFMAELDAEVEAARFLAGLDGE